MATNRTGEGRVGRGITDTLCVDVDGTLLLWPTKPGGATPSELAAAHRNVAALADRTPALVRYEDRDYVPSVNWPLVDAIKSWYDHRSDAGASPRIIIWTMGGSAHAALAMMCCGFDMGYMVECIGKPDLIIDDAKHDKLFASHRAVLPRDFIELVTK